RLQSCRRCGSEDQRRSEREKNSAAQASQGSRETVNSPAVADFAGKRGLVLGVANKRSIAWAIAKRLADGGAQLAFTYQGERIEAGVRELCGTVDSPLVTACDVRSAAGGVWMLTMTYRGGERAVPHYNVMGVAKAALDSSVQYLAWDLGAKNIRVNAVSAGPVRTLAARSIAGFPTMEAIVEERAPLH